MTDRSGSRFSTLESRAAPDGARAIPSPGLRERALAALRAQRFDLAEELLSSEDPGQEALIENLRIYQAELEIQNEELRQSQNQTQEALARFTSFFNTLPIAELVIDRQGLILEANLAAQGLFRLHGGHFHQHFFARLIAESDRAAVVAAWGDLAENTATVISEVRFRADRENTFIGDLHIASIPNLSEGPQHYVCAIIDRTEAVTQRQRLREASERLRESREHYRVLADFSSDWEFWIGADGGYLYVSPVCERISGYPPEAFVDDAQLFERLIHPLDRDLWQAHLAELTEDPAAPLATVEFRIRARNGEERWIEHVCGPVVREDGRFLGRRGVNHDITERKRFEARLDYLAHHDALTGLPNRAYFQARLEQCLHRAKRYRRRFALLFLDLDRFKEVNDTLGHHVGDALLCRVAEVLSAQIRDVDTIARLGGDEFVVILEDVPAPRFVTHFVDRVMDGFSRPLHVEGRDFFVTVSIGISLYPDDGSELETLVQHADIAMYQTKKSGRNGFRFFESAMSEGAIERLRLEHDLRLAMQRDEFVLYYQPQVDLHTGTLMGVEALCRWRHPQLGLLPPSLFIPMAEELGLIDELGLKVLELGCRQMADWDDKGLHIPRLAVNLSVRELERSRLPNQIAEILDRTRLDPARLELEVTESKLMRHADMAISALHAMRALGVTLAIDDFGTGYSSLSYLKRLPLNRLKIDRSFIEGLTHDLNDDSIARAIIALARTLGLEVLAEGVEAREQAEFLFREGCLEGQGYLYSRPMTAEELASSWPRSSDPDPGA